MHTQAHNHSHTCHARYSTPTFFCASATQPPRAAVASSAALRAPASKGMQDATRVSGHKMPHKPYVCNKRACYMKSHPDVLQHNDLSTMTCEDATIINVSQISTICSYTTCGKTTINVSEDNEVPVTTCEDATIINVSQISTICSYTTCDKTTINLSEDNEVPVTTCEDAK
jgi:hypothetical protein